MSDRTIKTISAVGSGVTTSFFDEDGMSKTIESLLSDVVEFYKEEQKTPWVIGYSGGKDSTAVLQIVWMALQRINKEDLKRDVYVVTNDTLVENPVVQHWVKQSHLQMDEAAKRQGLPISCKMLTPIIDETFWVNLIGRGYPAPNRRFRWCTERMKIHPTTRFIKEQVQKSGEAIIFLGARKAESAARAKRIEKYDKKSVRDNLNLSPHNDLEAALVYKPIVDWIDDDVWAFLMSYENPWGYENENLLNMYAGATADGECPLVIDTSTPSCGSSRFGCWTCTVVAKDKSMSAMIQNSAEKEWMLPLLDLRNELAEAGKETRDFRRMNGRVSLFNGEYVAGPYTQETRAYWLRKVLQAQTWVRENGPPEVSDIELITIEELHEIRRMWIVDKHEHEDLLPGIYKEETLKDFPTEGLLDLFPFGSEDLKILEEVSDSDLQYELLRELVSLEHFARSKTRRMGLYESIDSAFDRSGWETREEAINHMKAVSQAAEEAAEGKQTDYYEVLKEVIFVNESEEDHVSEEINSQ